MDTACKYAGESFWDSNKRYRRVVRFERVKIEFSVYIFVVFVLFLVFFFLVVWIILPAKFCFLI